MSRDGKHHATGEMLPLVIGRAEGQNNKANARLMAAAPQMLDALEALCAAVPAVDQEGDVAHEWLAARAAIAKARGAP